MLFLYLCTFPYLLANLSELKQRAMIKYWKTHGGINYCDKHNFIELKKIKNEIKIVIWYLN